MSVLSISSVTPVEIVPVIVFLANTVEEKLRFGLSPAGKVAMPYFAYGFMVIDVEAAS